MGAIEDRLAEMEIALPPENDDGTTAGPFGIVGADLFGLPVEIEAEVLIST